jgi:chondroitin AC lyase
MLPLKFYTPTIIFFLLLPWQTFADAHKTVLSARHKSADTSSRSDLEVIRARVVDDLLKPKVDETEIKQLLPSMLEDGSWPDINYKDVSRTGFQHSRHLHNMLVLARACKKPGSPFYDDPQVKEAASTAFDFWIEHDFISDNWWWNEMGTPNWVINTMLILDTDLTEKQRIEGLEIAGRANLEAFGARPGGDLIQIAGMLGKQALFRRDETILERVVNVIANEIKVTTGRGLQPDMSFHHRVDNVISTLSYGVGYADAFAYWAVKIAGTKFRFPESALKLLIDYYLDGICKSMVYGKFPDPGAKNRDLSRRGTLGAAGSELPENLMKVSDYRKEELEQIVHIRKENKEPNLTWDRFFWSSEYFTHQRPGYFASVRMHSSRNHTVEEPHNEEGLKNHHLGDGANYVSLTGKEYFDIFPVWNWQMVPGTTAVQKPSLSPPKDIARQGLTDFVGGVSDGTYGAAAFDFKSPHDPLKARKAWFFFDDEYVCLGSGISSTAEYPVYTTLNQCLLDGPVRVRTRKEEVTLPKGSRVVSGVSWIAHGGVAYIFPEEQAIGIANEKVTGSWRDITHQVNSEAEPVTHDVFALWIDHGIRPSRARYAYTVVPRATLSALDAYAKNPPVSVLANNESAQAVLQAGLSRAAVVFYEAGKIKIGDQVVLRAESPCMVLVKITGKYIESLSVSDPSRKLEHLQLKTSCEIKGSGDGWNAVWDKKEKSSLIDVDLPRGGYAGKSVVITFPRINE